jgi:hypothetical protein
MSADTSEILTFSPIYKHDIDHVFKLSAELSSLQYIMEDTDVKRTAVGSMVFRSRPGGYK